jgi:hypothetical protein
MIIVELFLNGGREMRQKIGIAMMGITILLTSCAQTPDNLADSKNHVPNTQADSSGEEGITMMSPEEILANKDAILAEIKAADYDNLTFPDNLDFEIPTEISDNQMMCTDYSEEECYALFEKYVPDEILENNKITDDKSYYPYGPAITDDADDFYCAVGNDGFFCLSEQWSAASQIPYACTYLETYYVGNGDSGDWDYDLDYEETLSDAIDTLVENAGDAYSYQTERISLCETDDGSRYYYVQAALLNSGVQTLNLTSTAGFLVDSALDLVLDEKGNIISTSVQHRYEKYGDDTALSEIVSPQDAVRLLSEELSGYKQNEVQGMELVYVPQFSENVQEAASGEKTYREQMQEDAASTEGVYPYDVFTLHPYWLIVLDYTPGAETLGLVDCEIGSVTYINDSVVSE